MSRVFIILILLISSPLIQAQETEDHYELIINESLIESTLSSLTDSTYLVLLNAYGRLGIDISKISNKELYLKAIDWLGVKYKYGHNSKNGIDCSGFVKNMVSGLLVDKLWGGSRDIYRQCKPIDKSQLAEGDLVFFKVNKPYISHVGIYLQNNKFIHATVREGVIISDLYEEYYQRYYYDSCRLDKL